MATLTEEIVLRKPEFRGAALALMSNHDTECCLDGPAGTGKTYVALYKVHAALTKYAGARALVARKSNTDLAGSAMATFRESILDEREGVHYFGGNRIKPAAFQYPNGSLMIVNGLDKASKVKSWEFDLAYINEGSECALEDIEFVRSRLRHGVMPYQQLLLDTNPDAPTHWLNQRMNEGTTTRLVSRHEDNPRFFDRVTQDWTAEGRAYIEGVLGGLTGVRLSRLRYGLWAAAEGTVYEDSWDARRNVIDRFAIPRSWPRYLSIDFGYTNPFVCQWWAMDPDGRLYLYREIYQSKVLVEDHCTQIALSSGWYHLLPRDHAEYSDRPPDWADPLPRELICDHDAEDRATLERHLKLYTTAAKKTVRDGLQAVSARLRPAGDGRPRLLFVRNALVYRDPYLVQAKKPTCTIEEFDSYVWKQDSAGMKEEPMKESDHGLDSCRYQVAHHDLQQAGVSYYPTIWR